MLSDLIDFVIKLSPLLALSIAWSGLSTWRRQLKGTDQYKIASELLLRVYEIREGINIVRSPLVQFRPTNDKNATKEMNEFYGYIETMERRWDNLLEAVPRISLLILKAEVYLNIDIKPELDIFMNLIRELQVTYEQYIEVKRPDSGFNLDDDFDKNARAVLWAKPNDDNFKKRLLDCIHKIEQLTRKYL